jgi:hypothetical protein
LADLGAGERDRTADLPFTRRLLCLLSYTGGDSCMVADPGADVRIYALTSGFTGLCVGYLSSVQVPPASRRPGAARPRLATGTVPWRI